MALIAPKLRAALRAVALSDADQAAAALAVHYAEAIDQGEELIKVGPPLLQALEALGMTPRARRSLVKGATHGGPASPLDELRRKRATRTAR